VTMKIHRSVSRLDYKYPFYTVWDTSNVIMAGYYGVPASGKLSRATAGTGSLKIFGNGFPCDMCDGYGFQDPIISLEDSSFNWITNLLWNCNGALASGDLFTAANHAGTACVGSNNPNCDPYPLRANLKFVDCVNYITGFAASGWVFANEETSLINDGVVFETFSPLGLSPDAGLQEIRHTSVVLVADYSAPSLFPGEGVTSHTFLGTDSNQRWLYTSGNFVQVPASPSGSSNVIDGSVAAFAVKVGDVVTFQTNSGSVPHGLVFSSNSFLTPLIGGPTASQNALFTSLYGTQAWELAPVLEDILFFGIVNDATTGTTLYFGDSVWGPYGMNGALVVVGDLAQDPSGPVPLSQFN